METKYYRGFRHNRIKKYLFGALVILAGLLLIGFNTGTFNEDYKYIVFSWQMLLIVIGLVNIFSRESVVSGIVLIAIGSFFIAPEIFPDLGEDFSNLFWPVVLILVGVAIIFRRRYPARWRHRFSDTEFRQDISADASYIDETNIFSGNKKVFHNKEFKGGRILNIFGGSEIDFTNTTLAEGENILDLTCIFGGVNLIVPSDWTVHVTLKSVLGGFNDKRRAIRTNGGNKMLIIKGIAIFGGGEIKSY